MFCHNCGNKLAEDASFCNKCGTKSMQVDKNPTQQAITVPSQSNAPDTTITTAAPNGETGQSNHDFKQFVDAHVRSTTPYQSTTDLLTNGSPSKLILLVAVPGLLLSLYFLFQSPNIIVGLVVFIFFGLLLSTYPLKFAVYFMKQGLAKKFNIGTDKCIDRDDFILFLNDNMKHLPTDMDKWLSIQVERSAIDGELTDAASCFINKATTAVITLPYESAALKQFKFNVLKDAGGNPTGIWSFIFLPVYFYNLILEMFNVGTGEYSVFYKTAPILSGAVKYYLNQSGGEK